MYRSTFLFLTLSLCIIFTSGCVRVISKIADILSIISFLDSQTSSEEERIKPLKNNSGEIKSISETIKKREVKSTKIIKMSTLQIKYTETDEFPKTIYFFNYNGLLPNIKITEAYNLIAYGDRYFTPDGKLAVPFYIQNGSDLIIQVSDYYGREGVISYEIN